MGAYVVNVLTIPAKVVTNLLLWWYLRGTYDVIMNYGIIIMISLLEIFTFVFVTVYAKRVIFVLYEHLNTGVFKNFPALSLNLRL